jgi:hypothetical protein
MRVRCLSVFFAAALLASAAKPPLAPRLPEVPQGTATNPIDRFLARYFAQHQVSPPAAVSEALFLRRAYLDLWGLLPTPEQAQAFLADRRADKRERLVRSLLDNRHNYAEHWISFWNDLLRNDEGVVYHGLRLSISSWLYPAIENNMPYDRFAAALLHPSAATDPKGFLVGVNWRGTVSASQIPAMQAAQNTAQIFLGVNLKCNSCHDSFISYWKLADAYGLAGFFADQPLDVYRCDKLTGAKASLKFLYPELGSVPEDASLDERQAAASRLFTGAANGRFARTFVNRIWDRLFGRGFVPGVDDLDGKPFDADLFDWLAMDFAGHGYDIQHLLEQIMTSQAYQLPAVAKPERASSDYVFRGPYPRRLTAEEFADAVAAVTGEWKILRSPKPEPGMYSREWRFKSSPLTRALGRPIRDQVYTERNSEATMLQALEVMNGATLSNVLHRGAARMQGKLPEPPVNLFDSGVCGQQGATRAMVDIDVSRSNRLILLVEDVDTYDPARAVAGWQNAELVGPGGVTPLESMAAKGTVTKRTLQFRNEQPAPGLAQVLDSRVEYDIAGKGFTRFRAVVGTEMVSYRSDVLGKVRFFVFDEEPDMQQLIRVAGEPPVATVAWQSGDRLVTQLFEYALLREPSARERALAARLVAEGGLEDLLWSVFLLPEFQYIR